MLNFLPVPRKRWGKCLLRGGGSALLPIRNHPGSVFPLTVEPGLYLVLWPPYHFLDFCDGADRVQQIHAFQKEKEVLWYTLPGGSVVKNLPAKEGDKRDTGSTPGLGRSPGVWNGNLLQCSCLENPMDRRPEGLQSIGSKRVRHDLATQLQEENVPLLNTSDVSSHNNSY